MGRKKLPTTLKLQKGTFAAYRDGNPALEMQSPVVRNLPPAPDSLGTKGAERWETVGKILAAATCLQESDLQALECYARAFDEVLRCDEVLRKDGNYIPTTTSVVMHPAVRERFQWLDLIRRYESEFGLTPSSRASVRKSEAPKTGIQPRRRA